MDPLNTLRRKVTPDTLNRLQPLLLLQMLVSVSQTVNGGLARSQSLARTLLLGGQQRLRDLMAAAPRLNLPVERWLEIVRSNSDKGSPEEKAAQALIELCLGLMLQWMVEDDRHRQHCAVLPARERQHPARRSSALLVSIPPYRFATARSDPRAIRA